LILIISVASEEIKGKEKFSLSHYQCKFLLFVLWCFRKKLLSNAKSISRWNRGSAEV